MAQTSVNIRMDEKTKKEFDRFCKEIGISVSTAFHLFAGKVVREQRIPFELTAEMPNADTAAAIEEAREFKAHPEEYKRYASFADFLKEVEEDA